jgi:hypothetical protein
MLAQILRLGTIQLHPKRARKRRRRTSPEEIFGKRNGASFFHLRLFRGTICLLNVDIRSFTASVHPPHHNFRIDVDIVWDIVQNKLPHLRKQFQKIISGETEARAP